MARTPNEKAAKAKELYKQGTPLIEISNKLDIPEGTVRSWKNRYNWDGKQNATLQKEKRNATKEAKRSAKEVESVMANTDLTDKQRLFCLYYVKYFNATKAYQKAYEVDYNTATSISYRLLEKDGVRNEIHRLKQSKLNQVMLEPSDIFQKYMDIAYADITDYLEFGREEVSVMTMYGPLVIKDEETGLQTKVTETINMVKFKESVNVDGTIISEVKKGKDGASIKLNDRMKALQWLTDHMDMATEEQKARIAVLKAKANLEDSGSTESDGFIEALEGKVDAIWQEE